jgi:hypothetical protein
MIRYGDFLLHNAAGALALPGVLVGALLTGIFSLATGWIMRNRLAELAEKTSFATTWLSTSLKRELNFAQDYFVRFTRICPIAGLTILLRQLP